MGRAKNTINPAEVSSTPIKVKYSVTYESSSLSNYGILIKSGSNITYNVNLSSSQVQEMNNYRLIRQLYYQNYLTGSLVGSASFWDPWWQSTAVSSSGDGTVYKFPTSANESILFYVIPPAQFGEQISRGTFNLSSSNATYNIVDDGNGNLVDILSSNKNVGNIFCAQGLAVITDQAYNTINNSQYHLSFSSETTIYQNEVRCLVNENDFNYTLNPSANKAGTSGSYIDAVTGSDFRPYATTIGLYNDADELLIVGKLSRPYAVAPNTDMTFVIRWDS